MSEEPRAANAINSLRALPLSALSPSLAVQCTLLIPHVFWPRETANSVLEGLTLTALTRLIARAHAERAPPLTSDVWLCQAFEVARQQDWPVAPLTLEIDGGEAADQYWLRADPVHIKVERDRLLLVESSLFDVSADEAAAFTQLLNKHFAEDAIVFRPFAPKRWYVSMPMAPALATSSPEEAAGHNVSDYLPTGADALEWHRVFNEAQMLLHEHAVNEAREARGEPAINSVWFWGGGTRPRVHGRHFSSVWSDDALATALAAATDIPAHALPRDAHAWLKSCSSHGVRGSHLIVLPHLATAMRYGDSDAWRTRALELETHWLAPLADALRDGRVTQLVIATPGHSASWRFDIGRSDLLKFWRTAKPLAEYA